MELPNNKWDHDYCRIPVEQTKCGGRLGIPEPLGLKQLEFRILLTQKSTSIRFLPEKFHGNLIQWVWKWMLFNSHGKEQKVKPSLHFSYNVECKPKSGKKGADKAKHGKVLYTCNKIDMAKPIMVQDPGRNFSRDPISLPQNKVWTKSLGEFIF